MSRVLAIVSEWVVRHRVAVQVALALLTIALASGAMRLRYELEPEALVPEDAETRRRSALAVDSFGPPSEPIVLVVEAADVTDRAVLEWMHAAARHLEERPWARRVDSLTTTPLPHFVTEDRPEPTLEDVERDPSAIDMALPLDPRMEILASLVATDPSRFPNGLVSLSERHEGARAITAPLVAGARVTEAEASAVRAFTERPSLVRGRLFDDARRVALVAASIRREGTGPDDPERVVRDVETWLASHPPPEGARARIGGLPHVRTVLVRALHDDALVLVALACLASMVVLVLGFRSVAGVLLPMAAVGMTVGMVTGTMGWLDEPITLLSNVIPPLLVTIGLEDAVHLLARYREERARGLAPTDAARRTFETMATACFLTSATTAVGFGSLAVSETPLLARFGLLAAGAVMAAYVIAILFMPSALASARANPKRAAHAAPWLDRGIALLGDASIARPRAIVLTSAILLAACLAAATSVPRDATLLDQLDPRSEAVATTRLIERELGGIRSLDVVLLGDPGTFTEARGLALLSRVEERARSREGVTRVESAVDWLESAWTDLTRDPRSGREALADPRRISGLYALLRADARHEIDRLVTPDGSRARIEVRLRDAGVRELGGLIDGLGGDLESLGAEGFIGGEAYRATRGLDRVVSDLVSSLALATLVIFTTLGVLFRSVRLALISIPPNLLPLAIVLSWMTARGIPVHVSTVIVFGVSIGLTVDGTIHVLARFREESGKADDRRTTIARTIRGSGRAVVLGSLALLLGFLTLLFSSFVPIRLFGELSAVAIIASIFAQLTLLPALLVLWGGGRDTRARTNAQ